MANTTNVFVYGTLRPQQSDTLADDSRYYAEIANYVKSSIPGQLKSARIFDIGTYPAAIPDKGTVYGDVLTVRARAMEVMDRIEGHPSFFKRKRTQIETENGPIKAWVYWAPRSLTVGRPYIANGDWLHREYEDEMEPGPIIAIDPKLLKLIKRFAKADCSWLSTVRPNNRPHSVPVWHIWLNGRIYVVSQPTAVKAINLKNNPSVTIAHPDPLNPVIIEGWGTFAPSMKNVIQPHFKIKYGWDIYTDQEYTAMIEVTPLKLLAWGKYGDGRWSGEQLLQVRLN
jgi:gamma-glutamylcyclotransferase (GGCT)/AIG2-like uncharacterized protein YtfP